MGIVWFVEMCMAYGMQIILLFACSQNVQIVFFICPSGIKYCRH